MAPTGLMRTFFGKKFMLFVRVDIYLCQLISSLFGKYAGEKVWMYQNETRYQPA